MLEDKCSIGLGPDVKTGYRIFVKGDCDKLLEDIKKNLGDYGKRYFEERIVRLKED